MNFSSSGDGQSEGDGERSSLVQPASAFDTLGKTQWAGSQENTLDDDIKQYTRIQILTLENKQQQKSSGTISSYWSVPEQYNFYNLLEYFGTDWQAIATTMKTKTHIMVGYPLPSTVIECTNKISRLKTFTIEKSRKASLASIWRRRVPVWTNNEQKG